MAEKPLAPLHQLSEIGKEGNACQIWLQTWEAEQLLYALEVLISETGELALDLDWLPVHEDVPNIRRQFKEVAIADYDIAQFAWCQRSHLV